MVKGVPCRVPSHGLAAWQRAAASHGLGGVRGLALSDDAMKRDAEAELRFPTRADVRKWLATQRCQMRNFVQDDDGWRLASSWYEYECSELLFANTTRKDETR